MCVDGDVRRKRKKEKRENNGDGKCEEEECVGSAPGLLDDSQLSLSVPVRRNVPRGARERERKETATHPAPYFAMPLLW